MSEPLYSNLTVTKKERSQVEIKAEIPFNKIVPYRDRALARLVRAADIPGFRKGHVPAHVVRERIGEQTLLFEAAEEALKEAYPQIIRDNDLDVIGRPEVSLTKLAEDNPVEFAILASLFPTLKLPDYKTLAREVTGKEESAGVTDAEVGSAIEHILRAHTKEEQHKAGDTEREPKLTDEFVKSLGDFNNVGDFKQKLRESMETEKKLKAKEKKRVELGEALVKGTVMDIPPVLVESELARMLAQFKGDIERMGAKFDEYLKRIEKTEEKLKEEWRPEAEKRAKLQLILADIARKENLKVDPDRVSKEVIHIKEHVKDVEEERARLYVENLLMNEEVFRFLEKQT